MTDPAKVATALKNALSVDVNHDDDGNFIAECNHDKLQTSLGSGVVQQALINSGYTIVPSENGFSVTHDNRDDNRDCGKLYGKDKSPKKDNEKKN
uniref:Uncharacterized protein n=1 Tax=Panagrolaimus davidi TaxID=227884 RepID=A0A914PCQ6_9BILA